MAETIDTEKKQVISYEQLAQELADGDLDKAEESVRYLLENNPNDPQLLNTQGTIYAERGDYYKAENAFGSVLNNNPDNCDAYYNLGLVHSKQSRFSESVENFLKAVELNPGDFAAHNDLGVLYHSQGKEHLARGHFIKALGANPLYKRALMNLFEICWENENYSEALEWIEKYLNNVPAKKTNRIVPVDQPSDDKSLILEAAAAPVVPETKQPKGTLTITKKQPAKTDDIFLKHVPEELWEKKTGQNIAVVADFNIAGQLSLLFRMLNRYTIHKARLIILNGDYLSYDKDLILSNGNSDDFEEAVKIIEKADFYHIGRFPKNFNDLDWGKYLKPNNSLVQYYGSEIRAHGADIYKWHNENKITGLSAWDHTMLEKAPLFYHINMMCDISRIKPASPPADVVRICHPPTNRQFKKTDLFLSTVEKLKEKYPVEVELIEGKSNDECLDIKSRCHITYDQISVGIYGLSAIESMAAGHAVLCGISNFAASYHPENPIVYVNEGNLYEKLEHLLKNKGEITRIGQQGRSWARTHHDPMKIIRQYLWMYDFVMNGHRYAEDNDAYLLK